MIRNIIIVFIASLAVASCSNEPVIGILSEELFGSLKEAYPNYTSYIAASYVKAVQGSGGRVVPILIGQSKEYYREKISSLNGIVFPGGACNFDVPNGYAEAGEHIYDIAKEINEGGGYFPILGVCLGFELLLYLANNKTDLRSKCESENIGLSLMFVPGFKESRLFKSADENILYILESSPVTSNHHTRCVTPKSLKKAGLKSNWKVLSVNKDIFGLLFISSVESLKFPFAGIQFHPEKNMYEWKVSQNNPHSEKAIVSARYFYDWIIGEASKNNHAYPSEVKKMDELIENYQTHFSGKLNLTFNEVYLFS